ncbi:MAG: peptidylprolyl isomerase [Nitrospirota bacterium]
MFRSHAVHRRRRSGTLRRLWAVGLLFLPSLVSALPPAQAAHLTDRIVAVVNTEVITLSELKAETQETEKKLRAKFRGTELERRLRQAEFAALTRMIEQRLQVQFARAKGVDVTDEEIKGTIKDLKRQGEKFNESDEAAMRALREQLMLMKVVDREIRGGIMISDTELRRYYIQHQSRFLLPEEYRISQILILQRSPDERAQARARAAEIHEELKRGADFADLALRRSDGPEATRGGSLGLVRQGELLPQIERALATLQGGEFSEPIETPQGFHIIRLEEKTPPQFRPFAEVKTEIHGLVYSQKSEDMYQVWLADLKNRAYIEVKF